MFLPLRYHQAEKCNIRHKIQIQAYRHTVLKFALNEQGKQRRNILNTQYCLD